MAVGIGVYFAGNLAVGQLKKLAMAILLLKTAILLIADNMKKPFMVMVCHFLVMHKQQKLD
mgnify:CR=1 FL=1